MRLGKHVVYGHLNVSEENIAQFLFYLIFQIPLFPWLELLSPQLCR